MNNKFFKRTISAFISAFFIISNSAVFAETNDIFVPPSNCISKSDENKNTRIIAFIKRTFKKHLLLLTHSFAILYRR